MKKYLYKPEYIWLLQTKGDKECLRIQNLYYTYKEILKTSWKNIWVYKDIANNWETQTYCSVSYIWILEKSLSWEYNEEKQEKGLCKCKQKYRKEITWCYFFYYLFP